METQETNSQISASVIRAYLMYALVVKISYHDQEIESHAGHYRKYHNGKSEL